MPQAIRLSILPGTSPDQPSELRAELVLASGTVVDIQRVPLPEFLRQGGATLNLMDNAADIVADPLVSTAVGYVRNSLLEWRPDWDIKADRMARKWWQFRGRKVLSAIRLTESAYLDGQEVKRSVHEYQTPGLTAGATAGKPS